MPATPTAPVMTPVQTASLGTDGTAVVVADCRALRASRGSQ
jgi:hypothetical protein